MKLSISSIWQNLRLLTSRTAGFLFIALLCPLLNGCIISVTASSHDGNTPLNTLDTSLAPDSRWSAYGDGEWIQYELSHLQPVSSLDIAFYRGDTRRSYFEIWLGDTPETMKRVYAGKSSGNTVELESFNFAPEAARYVRIVGYGNSENNWNSITEVSLPYALPDNGNGGGNDSGGNARPVLQETFESEALGSRWLGMSLATVQIGCGVNRSRCLRVKYEPYSRGSRRLVNEVPLPSAKEYTLQYDVKFDRGFEFVRGGKMHGLGPVNKTSGCNPIESDGWSARVMWRNNGRAQLYAYHQDRQNNCGDGRLADVNFVKGRYQSVSLYVRVNSRQDRSDGELALFIDGDEVARWPNIRLRSDINKATEINRFYFSTFHGGNDESWAPSENVYAYYDNFAVVPGLDVRQEPGDL